tara:strand:+ start:272 stop:508 length:237 start_codon:yes stop_codon:yes gene_type:complete
MTNKEPNSYDLFIKKKRVFTGSRQEVHDKAVELNPKFSHDEGTVIRWRADFTTFHYLSPTDIEEKSFGKPSKARQWNV